MANDIIDRRILDFDMEYLFSEWMGGIVSTPPDTGFTAEDIAKAAIEAIFNVKE